MISPEVLRRFPFFGVLDDDCLKEVAMLADEGAFAKGQEIYTTGDPSDTLYLLMDGSVETYLVITDPDNPKHQKSFYLGDVNPGDVFGMSAMVEPYQHTTMTRAGQDCQVIAVNSAALRQLCDSNPQAGLALMKQVAAAALGRLQSTRVQLAATRSG